MKKIISLMVLVAMMATMLPVNLTEAATSSVNIKNADADEHALELLPQSTATEKASYKELKRLRDLAINYGWTVSQEFWRTESANRVTTKVRFKSSSWAFKFFVVTYAKKGGYIHYYAQDGEWMQKADIEGLIKDPQYYYSLPKGMVYDSEDLVVKTEPTSPPAETKATTNKAATKEDTSSSSTAKATNKYSISNLSCKTKLEKRAYKALRAIDSLAKKTGWTKSRKYVRKYSSKTKVKTRVFLTAKHYKVAFTNVVKKARRKTRVLWYQGKQVTVKSLKVLLKKYGRKK